VRPLNGGPKSDRRTPVPGPISAPLPVAALSPSERVACLRLARTENVGPVTFRKLINQFGGAEAALAALPDIARRGGRKTVPRSPTVRDATNELAAADRCQAQAIFTIEPGYPRALAALDHPPPMLYVRGAPEILARPCVAIVGSRRASAIGIGFARQLAAALTADGFVVVSGLARGIDGAAHQAALMGGTAAVVAGGVDVIYPPEHVELQQHIADMGCIVSELPPGTRPRGKDFPRRNRIISGLSLGVVVVEAADRSGSLITARLANEQGRVVFAVPGHPLDPRAFGTNALIKQGAVMVTGYDDLREALTPMVSAPLRHHDNDHDQHHEIIGHAAPNRPSQADPLEDPLSIGPTPPWDIPIDATDRQTVLGSLSPAPAPIDEITRATGLPVQAVHAALLELSIAGRVIFHGSQLVSRSQAVDNPE